MLNRGLRVPSPDQSCPLSLICSDWGHCIEKGSKISSRLNGKDAQFH